MRSSPTPPRARHSRARRRSGKAMTCVRDWRTANCSRTLPGSWMTRTRFALLLLGLLPVMTTAAAPEHAPWPGGIAVIDVGPAEAPRPIVEFDERRVLVTRNGDRWLAAVGIPLDAQPGELSVRVNTARVIAFEVHEHAYSEQRLTVKNK